MPKRKRKVIKRPPKPRLKRGTLVRCYTCPSTHPGWMRSVLKNRKRLPYCPEHLEIYDKQQKPWWPLCPQCEGEEFGTMQWGGSVRATTASCDDCGFNALALDYFTRACVWVTASPIDRSK